MAWALRVIRHYTQLALAAATLPGQRGCCHPGQGQLLLHALCTGFRGSYLLPVHGPLVVPCLAGGGSPRKSHSPDRAGELFVGGGQGLMREAVPMMRAEGEIMACVYGPCAAAPVASSSIAAATFATAAWYAWQPRKGGGVGVLVLLVS